IERPSLILGTAPALQASPSGNASRLPEPQDERWSFNNQEKDLEEKEKIKKRRFNRNQQRHIFRCI
ncbi:MAG: hypothetical protein KDD61_15255, partial [Bdellovibrionales bacterium]|nr:hypothetical protein [Bdellovibrionales bacterium]